ncbi:MAG: hypothetical protein ACRYGM_15235 [Janthinobacterium lividum]
MRDRTAAEATGLITDHAAPPGRTPSGRVPPGCAPSAPERHLRIEQLPKALLCVPLVLQWLWLSLRYRSLTLPSSLNPGIETGGLVGESKSGCLARIDEAFAPWVAAWCRVRPGADPQRARLAAGLAFPLIAKPDIGWCGYGVRRIDDAAALQAYAGGVPADADFILQHLVAAPNEAGLLYVRRPGAAEGALVAMTQRHPPAVTGDGRRSVAALIEHDARCRRHRAAYEASAGEAALRRVPAPGEQVVLTTIASLRVGARYEDISAQITAPLASRVAAIAGSMPGFHYGRFDVRFTSVAALREGRFSIIEVNGAGSEAIQFWDPSLRLLDAFRGVFAKQRQLFELGDAMRRRGHAPVGPVALARAWLHQQSRLRRFPASG